MDRPMTGLDFFLTGWAVAALLMLVAWIVQWRSRDAGVVDFTWAAGLGVLAIGYALVADGDPLRRILVAILAGGWSFRLAAYILVNRLIGKPEDGRYQRLRVHWREHDRKRNRRCYRDSSRTTGGRGPACRCRCRAASCWRERP